MGYENSDRHIEISIRLRHACASIVKVVIMIVAFELVEPVVVGTFALRPPSLSQTTIAELELITCHFKLLSTNVKERSLFGRKGRQVRREVGLGEEDGIREVPVQLGEVEGQRVGTKDLRGGQRSAMPGE